MPRGTTTCGGVVVMVRRVMMMVVVMMIVGIQFTILVEHLTWPPGPTHGRFSACRAIGLPAPWRHLVLLTCFPGRLSLILLAHDWDVI